MTGERRHTCSAYLTFVALDETRRPTAIEPAIPETETELRRFEEAAKRRFYRLAMNSRKKRIHYLKAQAFVHVLDSRLVQQHVGLAGAGSP